MQEWIQSVWNSIEALASVNLWAQSIVAFTLLATFLFTGVGLVAGWRKEVLQRAKDLQAEQIIADTNRTAAEANARAGAANERAARLEVEAEEARLRAEQERLARVKLQEQLAPRRLSGVQKKSMIQELSKSARHTVVVVSRLLDNEGGDFAEDLASALREAKWSVSTNKTNLGDQEGIMVGGLPGVVPGLETLSKALSAADLDFTTQALESDPGRGTTLSPGTLYLIIGLKPSVTPPARQ